MHSGHRAEVKAHSLLQASPFPATMEGCTGWKPPTPCPPTSAQGACAAGSAHLHAIGLVPHGDRLAAHVAHGA